MTRGDIVEVKNTPKEKEVLWKIPDFLSLSIYYHDSPNFKFLDACWFLKLDPLESNSDHIALHLELKETDMSSYNVLSTFSIKKSGDSRIGVNSFYHTFSKLKSSVIARHFFARSVLTRYASELLPSNELTIVCNLKQLADPVKLTGLDTLSDHFKNLLANKNSCDVTLQVKDKEFRAHKVVLIARSPVFAAMFEHDLREKQTGIINIPDCDPESFDDFLEYLYSGKLENATIKCAFHLYKTAEKYDVQELKMFCILQIERNLKVENVCDVVALAEEYGEKEITAVAQDFFNRNFKEILISAEWKTLLTNNCDLANKLLLDMTYNINVENNLEWEISKRKK